MGLSERLITRKSQTWLDEERGFLGTQQEFESWFVDWCQRARAQDLPPLMLKLDPPPSRSKKDKRR